MTLRRRLQLFIAFFAITLLGVAIWERIIYLEARAEISETVALDIRLDEVADQLSWVLSSSILVSLVLLGLAWFFLERWVLAPLDEMRTELRMVASGTIHQVIEVANPPEIQLAAADAESMRQNLVSQIDLARAAWQGLEQDAPLVASMRKALSPTLIDTEKFGLDVAGQTLPASGAIAGDWWDVIRTPQGTALAMVDVTGHGPEAGVVGLQIKAIMTAALSAGFTPSAVMERVSAGLSDVDALLATAVILEIPNDLSQPTKWVNAGHPAGYWIDANHLITTLNPTGPMLGGFGGVWQSQDIFFGTGDRIVLVSDGLLETQDEKGEEFGTQGLVTSVVSGDRSANSAELTNLIVSTARQDSVTWNRDDVSVVVITRRLGL
jgi:serine phosphatase RsbU (regulator of sigma subunit)